MLLGVHARLPRAAVPGCCMSVTSHPLVPIQTGLYGRETHSSWAGRKALTIGLLRSLTEPVVENSAEPGGLRTDLLPTGPAGLCFSQWVCSILQTLPAFFCLHISLYMPLTSPPAPGLHNHPALAPTTYGSCLIKFPIPNLGERSQQAQCYFLSLPHSSELEFWSTSGPVSDWVKYRVKWLRRSPSRGCGKGRHFKKCLFN